MSKQTPDSHESNKLSMQGFYLNLGEETTKLPNYIQVGFLNMHGF